MRWGAEGRFSHNPTETRSRARNEGVTQQGEFPAEVAAQGETGLEERVPKEERAEAEGEASCT